MIAFQSTARNFFIFSSSMACRLIRSPALSRGLLGVVATIGPGFSPKTPSRSIPNSTFRHLNQVPNHFLSKWTLGTANSTKTRCKSFVKVKIIHGENWKLKNYHHGIEARMVGDFYCVKCKFSWKYINNWCCVEKNWFQ